MLFTDCFLNLGEPTRSDYERNTAVKNDITAEIKEVKTGKAELKARILEMNSGQTEMNSGQVKTKVGQARNECRARWNGNKTERENTKPKVRNKSDNGRYWTDSNEDGMYWTTNSSCKARCTREDKKSEIRCYRIRSINFWKKYYWG